VKLKNRDAIVQAIAHQDIEQMTEQEISDYLFEIMCENVESWTDEELVQLVHDEYPYLAEGLQVETP